MGDLVASCPPGISRPIMSRRCSLDSSCMRRSDTPSRRRPGRRCSFTSVSVREHESCLGDNPSCQEGAPISLSWTVTSEKSVPLEDFESSRKNQRRDRRELILCPAERRKMLIRKLKRIKMLRPLLSLAISSGMVIQLWMKERVMVFCHSKNGTL